MYRAVVKAEGTQAGAPTDERGMFILKGVPVGWHTVSVSMVGYETAILKEVLAGSAKEVYLEVGLVQKPVELGKFGFFCRRISCRV